MNRPSRGFISLAFGIISDIEAYQTYLPPDTALRVGRARLCTVRHCSSVHHEPQSWIIMATFSKPVREHIPLCTSVYASSRPASSSAQNASRSLYRRRVRKQRQESYPSLVYNEITFRVSIRFLH